MLSKKAVKPPNPFYFVDELQKLSEYSFTVGLIRLVNDIRNIKEAHLSKFIRSDPGSEDQVLWCGFHGTHGTTPEITGISEKTWSYF